MGSKKVHPSDVERTVVALLLDAQHYESRARDQNWSSQCQYKVTEWNIMSNVWGMIFQ